MTTRPVRTTASALILRSRPIVQSATDTGKRLIAGQVATSHGESWDKGWQFVGAPAGDGWASTAYLQPVTGTAPVVSVSRWPRVPNGRAEIIALFGQPCKPVCESGRVPLPASLPLSWALSQRVTRFACHELLAPVLTSVFAEIHRRGYWSLLEDFGGCYNCREQRGTSTKTSTHSWGIGIDLNTNSFPIGSTKKQDARLKGIFADHGFVSGDIWGRPDPMHWQYATGY